MTIMQVTFLPQQIPFLEPGEEHQSKPPNWSRRLLTRRALKAMLLPSFLGYLLLSPQKHQDQMDSETGGPPAAKPPGSPLTECDLFHREAPWAGYLRSPGKYRLKPSPKEGKEAKDQPVVRKEENPSVPGGLF